MTNENSIPMLPNDFIKIPSICTFNLPDSDNEKIKNAKFNLFPGTFGNLVRVENRYNHGHFCLINSIIPDNLHEFNIIITDLTTEKEIDYDIRDNQKSKINTSEDYYFYCEYPKNIFDPRAYAAYSTKKIFAELEDKDSIVIIFASEHTDTEYVLASKDGDYAKIRNKTTLNNYSFLPNGIRHSKNKKGSIVKTNNENRNTLNKILNEYITIMSYECTFYHPNEWNGSENKKKETFIPLLYNDKDEIVGYAELNEKQWIFVFPKMNQKGEFILELLNDFFPKLLPQIFPENKINHWTTSQEYYLPNQESLLNQKEGLLEKHKKEIADIEFQILENQKKYSFLHGILTDTGDELVKNCIKFFEWLEFSNVKNMDEENLPIKEEDIQIELEDGLLIIECKGIRGTSKDEECAQISKIRSRRCEARNKFDVYALYLVNHQRHLPPEERRNPPFTEFQISDAVIEKRGLATTWTLFNLFFLIENKILTKKEARETFRNIGLLEFPTTNLISLGIACEVFQNGNVIIIKQIHTQISISSKLVIKDSSKFKLLEIESIQVNGKSVERVSEGEIGLKLSQKVKLNTEIFIIKENFG